MNCKNCNKPLRENAKFCGNCGTSTLLIRKCKACDTKLDEDELFCYNCGMMYDKNTISTSSPITKNESTPLVEQINKNTLSTTSSVTPGILLETVYTLKFEKHITEDEKKIVRKIKKSNSSYLSLFLYDKKNNVMYTKSEDDNIRSFSPNDILGTLRKYTVSPIIWDLWNKSTHKPEHFYFYNDVDAFLAWDGYLFLSVYHGEILWTASDSRDAHYLPEQKANESMFAPGTPKLEVLSDGSFICTHFFGGKKFKINKGILIPIE